VLVPTFPTFKRLELSDKELFYSFTEQFPPFSDFNFVSIFTYDTGETEFSILNNNLVIKMPDYITSQPFYSFLGKEKTKETIETILKHLRESSQSAVIKLLPESSISEYKLLFEAKYLLKKDRDSFDYILSVQQMTDLVGSVFHDQRNLIKQMPKEYPNHQIKSLDLCNEKVKAQILDLCQTWAERKQKSNEEAEREMRAVSKLLEHANDLPVKAIGIYDFDHLCAFFIYEAIDKRYLLGHYRKANTLYPGIFTYIDHVLAKMMVSEGFEYLNFEQDMGIESLREAKEAWQPVFFLRKYTLAEK